MRPGQSSPKAEWLLGGFAMRAGVTFRSIALTTLSVAFLSAAALAQPQNGANGIASPIQKVSPTGAVTIPQAEEPSVGTLDPVQPHWVFVNRGNGQDGPRIFDGDSGKMRGMVNMYGDRKSTRLNSSH